MKFICELSGIGGILGIPLHKRSHCISALCSRHGAGILGGFTVNNVHLFKLILVAFLVCFPYERLKAQSVVQLRKTGETWELTRDGEPYFIRGVGGTGSLSFLKQLGGNSIRTWSVEDAERTLDAAYAEGVTVCVGMWLEHERHGFDYQDQARVQQQKRRCLDSVKRLKDHPAVLMWGIGNEMEGNGKDPAIWKAVEEIAEEIKSLDPNHPTMTVIAELGEGENKIRAIEEHCPSIDVIGVNSYGGITTLASRFKNAKVSKPFVITEHGPAGPWEVGKTSWDSPIEASSTEKAKLYASGYEASVASQAGLCLGAYSFLWGHKQETTATWFGMLLPDGSRLAAVDVISSAWTGKPPANRCPEIEILSLGKEVAFQPGQPITANLVASDPESDPIEVRWVLRKDSGTIGIGGDREASERAFNDWIVNTDNATATVSIPINGVPRDGGNFRLFAYVDDGHGGAAVANVAFQVKPR